MDAWFRVEDGRYAPMLDEFENPIGRGRAYVSMYAFFVLRETPKGVWLDVYGQEKFVLRSARKRWACPTKQEAIESFIARKERQLSILDKQTSHVEEVLVEAKTKTNWTVRNLDI